MCYFRLTERFYRYTALTVPDSKAGGFRVTWEGHVVALFHNTTHRTVEIDLSQLTDQVFTALSASIGVENASLYCSRFKIATIRGKLRLSALKISAAPDSPHTALQGESAVYLGPRRFFAAKPRALPMQSCGFYAAGQNEVYCSIWRPTIPAAVSATLISVSPMRAPCSRDKSSTAPMASPSAMMGDTTWAV